jgi:MFS family permease
VTTTLADSTTGTRPRPSVAALPVVGAATLLSLMNYTAPMAALRTISHGLGAGPQGQTWILSAIGLGLAALLLVAGSLADDFGRRRMFAVGAGLLAASSVLCAVATDPVVFVVGRIGQGGASAALLAAGLGLLGHTYPAGRERVRATGIWGAMVGAGIATGPLAGALLAELGGAGWRWWYWIVAVASAVLAVVAARTLSKSKADSPRGLDLPGVVTLGGGLAALIAAITQGRAGWGSPAVAILFAVAAVLLVAFVGVERAQKSPMLDLALFRRPSFVVATTGALFTGLAIIGPMSFLPTLMIRVRGATAIDGAFALLLWSGIAFAVSLQARRLRFEARHQIATGLVLAAVAATMLLGLGSLGWLVTSLVIAGVGSGLINAALGRLAVESVPAGRGAMGSGANNTARYVGGSVGIAMVVALAAHGPDPAFVVSAVLALAAALVITLVGRRS